MRNINIKKSRGISIVEFMVSIAIGLLILSGVIVTVSNGKRNFVDQEEMAFIQENARFAIDILTREIRMAGYMGCSAEGSADIANVVQATVNGFISTVPIQGFEDGSTIAAFLTPIASHTSGTDGFIVRHADVENSLPIQNHDESNSRFEFFNNHGFEVDELAMVVDANCRNVGLFRVFDIPASTQLRHLASSANCSDLLGGSADCGGGSFYTHKYGPGSTVSRYRANAYFVDDSNILPGVPALKREVLIISGGSLTTREEELVTGVEDMELAYGIDGDADGIIEQYVNAEGLDLDASLTVDEDEWRTIRAVRVSLTFRSQSEVHSTAQSITLNGVAYNDRFLHQAVTTTVQLRN